MNSIIKRVVTGGCSLLLMTSFLCGCKSVGEVENKALAQKILNDQLMVKVDSMAHEVIKTGFNAGDGYGEVWIRDYNTFIELAMDEMPDERVQDNLLTFFRFQGEDGNIVDGFIDAKKAIDVPGGYKYIRTSLEPRYAAHKNTVETDHEASLIQAVWRYVNKSENYAFLDTEIANRTVLQRLEDALNFLHDKKYTEKYGLIWGATTSDWGDVQPEHIWGVEIDENTHYCVDIYDNAFFIIAIDCYNDMLNKCIELNPELEEEYTVKINRWTKVKENIFENVRKHLWDEDNQKFIPHLYLADSPFPDDFDENQIFYHGGTAMAIEAGLLSEEEIKISNEKMLKNVEDSGAPTIGLTVYPPYPEGYFMGKGMYPYGYQNGGDWTWFGGRMILQLIENGFVEEAYDEVQPMLERVVKNNGFYEWYSVDGVPSGSGTFRGAAGVLHNCILAFNDWANEHK